MASLWECVTLCFEVCTSYAAVDSCVRVQECSVGVEHCGLDSCTLDLRSVDMCGVSFKRGEDMY